MNLNEALTLIATRLNLDPQALIDFAAEDNVGGWDTDERLHGWPNGSVWSVEGKVLYALVRALRPQRCVEFGTWYGCSASHITSALKANGSGKLVCVDHHGFGGIRIKPDLLDYVEFVSMNLHNYLPETTETFDFIFEDAEHWVEQVEAVWSDAVHSPLLNPGGVIVSHDAMHFTAGVAVQAGITAADVEDVLSVLIEPGDCGLALWRKGDEPKRKPATKKKVAK